MLYQMLSKIRPRIIDQLSQSGKPGQWFPVISLLFAATLWGVFWYPLRVFADYGLTGLWSSLLIYAGTLPVLLLILYSHRRELNRAPGMLILIALASGWCNTAFILAMLEGHVVRVLLLFYLSPVWTVILGVIFLKERPHRSGVITIVVAMLGAVIMLWDPEVGVPIPRNSADWLALSSGMAFSVTNIAVRYTQSVSVRVKTVVAWIGAVVVAGVMLLLEGQGLHVSTGLVIAAALLYGLIVMVIMTLTVQYGVTHMPAHRSAVILLFEIVVGAVSAFFLTDEVISLQEWIGGLLVMGAAYLSSRLPHEDTAGIT